MDTEFPGVVYTCTSNSPDFCYQYVKTNVKKLIQFGITLTNAKGKNHQIQPHANLI